jgi:hypothetical protein
MLRLHIYTFENIDSQQISNYDLPPYMQPTYFEQT